MPYPTFESPAFLKDHVASILSFYEPNVYDPSGGFFQNFRDDGTVYDARTRHLVSSTRFVFNYVNAYLQNGVTQHRDWASHGFAYLLARHRQSNGVYIWQINGNEIEDGRAMAYGHAFVMLAAAWAARLEIDGAERTLSEVWDFMETYFWEPAHTAYADERDASLQTLNHYRGQNANMHAVEALIAAYETTQGNRYLERAELVARHFCRTLAAMAEGQIWEHYTENWMPDWKYNIDKPGDLFKPWGFQPGHQVEWSKLLLQLDALRSQDWYLPMARQLFDNAIERGWDKDYGGLVYGYAPDGSFADTHKYFWVHAEAFAAAWRLYKRTSAQHYFDEYQRIWRWAWDHLVDHRHGAWYRIVARDGHWLEPYKSPVGKVDYHTMGACWDVLQVQKA